VQHDGNVIARLIAARSAGRFRAMNRVVAVPCRFFRMSAPNFARLDRGNRSSEWAVTAGFFLPDEKPQVEALRRRITSAKLTSFNEDCIRKYYYVLG